MSRDGHISEDAALGFKRLGIFCGSNRGVRPEYGAAARKLSVPGGAWSRDCVWRGLLGLMGELAMPRSRRVGTSLASSKSSRGERNCS